MGETKHSHAQWQWNGRGFCPGCLQYIEKGIPVIVYRDGKPQERLAHDAACIARANERVVCIPEVNHAR